MGLDAVEMIMDIEDEFNISIPDEEAEKMRTINNLYEYVSKVYDRDKDTRKVVPCASQHAFYKLRKALMEMTNAQRKSIRPDTDLKTYLHPENKMSFWDELKEKTNCKLPEFYIKAKYALLCIAFPLIAVIIAFSTSLYYERNMEDALSYSALGLLIGFILSIFIAFTISKFPFMLNDLPSRCKKLRDLVKCIAVKNYISENVSMDLKERIYHIVAECAGVDEKELTLETDFVKDLAF